MTTIRELITKLEEVERQEGDLPLRMEYDGYELDSVAFEVRAAASWIDNQNQPRHYPKRIVFLT